MKRFVGLVCLFLAVPGLGGDFQFDLQPGATWQSRNEFAIPPAGGSRLDLADTTSGPFFTARGYATWNVNERHSLRLLIAPFSASIAFTPTSQVVFNGTNYAANTPLTASYKFNSYRLTYFYRFESESDWKLRLGFTAKIRDANISLTDGTTLTEDPNVGFVPLIHFGATWTPCESWWLEFDFDGLMAPQGRAFDIALYSGHPIAEDWSIQWGYRTVEGGAENTSVYTFAWLHTVFAGVRYTL